ncbi:MAG TPA: hypothetical protein VFB66_16130 [Tepidisphaeraceae bacterium]|nr:hypothetical protein [Tepidisphaeraceae bacterium]
MTFASPRVTPNERLGHALRVKIPKLAEAVVDEQYRRRPELEARYGPGGRAHCVKDTVHNLRFLAESVAFGQPRIFCDYVEWALRVMTHYGVAAEDVAENLRLLAGTLERHLPGDVAGVAREHVEAALARLNAATG